MRKLKIGRHELTPPHFKVYEQLASPSTVEKLAIKLSIDEDMVECILSSLIDEGFVSRSAGMRVTAIYTAL